MPAKKKTKNEGTPRPSARNTQPLRKRADGQTGPSVNAGKALAKKGKQPAKKTIPESGGVRGQTKKTSEKGAARPAPKKATSKRPAAKSAATKNAGARKAA